MVKNKKNRGFTLIELLMVVAIIAILATIILVGLNSARERASVNKYLSYGVQMHRLVADAVAAGYFDRGAIASSAGLSSFPDGTQSYCLGNYGALGCGTNGDIITAASAGLDGAVHNALTQLSDFPEKVEYSPYNPGEGVSMDLNYDDSYIRIWMYLLSNDDYFLQKTCNSIGWGVDGSGYCYIDVPLNARL